MERKYQNGIELIIIPSTSHLSLPEHSPPDPDNEGQLSLSRDNDGALLLGFTDEVNLLLLNGAVLLDVLLSTAEDCHALGPQSLLSLGKIGRINLC